MLSDYIGSIYHQTINLYVSTYHVENSDDRVNWKTVSEVLKAIHNVVVNKYAGRVEYMVVYVYDSDNEQTHEPLHKYIIHNSGIRLQHAVLNQLISLLEITHDIDIKVSLV